ncbi:MAG: hypothetical protein GXO07_04120 [Crenarchaeota archaeon]|nr:hypothetical protein [Thermoproteota archaeon]
MTRNPSDEAVIDPSPRGALCLVVELVLALSSLMWLPSAVAYSLLGHPAFGIAVAIYLSLKNPLFLLLTLVGIARARKGRCWPLWRGTYCCSPGGLPWFVLVKER